MKLNINAPILRLSVELTSEQVVTLAKTAIDMATEEDSQDEEGEDVVVEGFFVVGQDPADLEDPQDDGAPPPGGTQSDD